MRAAIYTRISQDKTGEGSGVERQREDCLALCKMRGWEPVYYQDNDISAKVANKRPAFKEMLADIETGEIKYIVAWSLDRLTRNARDRLAMVEACRDHGVIITLVKGTDMDATTASGRAVIDMLGVVAQMEIDQKSERQERAAKQAAEAGKGWGGRRAFGYTRDNLVKQDEAKLIRKAYKSILAGESLYSVATQWNKTGITTTVGNQWSGSTVGQLLKNPRYCGKRSYKGDIVADAQWRPLVTEEVWQSVNGILADVGRRRNRAPGRKYLLSGLLRCGRCADGTTMGSGVADSDGAVIYVCKRCHRLSRRMAPVDELVTKLVSAYLKKHCTDLLTDSTQVDMAALREQERNILDKIDGLAVDLADGLLTKRQVKVATDRHNEQLAEVRGKMQPSRNRHIFDGLEDAVAKGFVKEWFEGLPLDRQRGIVDTIVVFTLIPAGRGRPFHRDHLGIDWVSGDD